MGIGYNMNKGEYIMRQKTVDMKEKEFYKSRNIEVVMDTNEWFELLPKLIIDHINPVDSENPPFLDHGKMLIGPNETRMYMYQPYGDHESARDEIDDWCRYRGLTAYISKEDSFHNEGTYLVLISIKDVDAFLTYCRTVLQKEDFLQSLRGNYFMKNKFLPIVRSTEFENYIYNDLYKKACVKLMQTNNYFIDAPVPEILLKDEDILLEVMRNQNSVVKLIYMFQNCVKTEKVWDYFLRHAPDCIDSYINFYGGRNFRTIAKYIKDVDTMGLHIHKVFLDEETFSEVKEICPEIIKYTLGLN